MTFNLFQDQYSLPSGSADYLKMPDGGASIKVVILDTVVTGWSYWTADKQCIRSATPFKSTPGIRPAEEGKKAEAPKHFWAMKVYDFESKSIKILEVTQRSIQEAILSIHEGDDYDLNDMTVALRISAEGAGLKKSYKILPVAVKIFDWQATLANFDLMEKDLKEVIFADSVTTPSEDDAPTLPAPILTPTDMM